MECSPYVGRTGKGAVWVDWYWWVLAWMVFGSGGWLRHALHTHHRRKLELAKVESARQRAIEAAGKPPEPVCGCTHHLAKHDKQGKCHEVVQAPTAWDQDKKPVAYEPQPCSCQQYIGPRPMATLYAEEIVDL